MKISNIGKISDRVEIVSKQLEKEQEKIENNNKKTESKLIEMKSELTAKVNSDQKVVLDFMKENFITSSIL